MKNIILVVVVSCMLSIGLFAESKGENIFMSKCVACHAFKGDVSKSNRLAPPMSGVMLHMNESFKTKGKGGKGKEDNGIQYLKTNHSSYSQSENSTDTPKPIQDKTKRSILGQYMQKA